tara:strand:+ start:639 stop:2048 length:1410 start_codon:yes stop_codon:yes gene_type:complete
MYSRKSINLIIFFSFLISILLSANYLFKYDHLRVTQSKNGIEHPMIKIAVGNHWDDGNIIIQNIKKGKNFFSSRSQYTEFLPSKFLALYYYIIGEEIYDDNKNLKTDNGKLLYLIIKTSLYYLALIFFSHKIISIFPIKICFFIILFLTFEPSIFQYHSSFWNESLFFPFQILMLTFLLSPSHKFFINLLLGIMLGLMYSTSKETFFYFVPIIFYLIIIFRKKCFKPVLGFMMGFIIFLSSISYLNYKRDGAAYYMSYSVKTPLYLYLAPHVLAIKEKSSIEEAQKKMMLETEKFMKKNDLKLKDPTRKFRNISVAGSLKVQLFFYDYIQKAALDIIIKNPIPTIKHVFNKNLHTLVLDPFYIKGFYEHEERGVNQYYKSKMQQKVIPYRIIYTIMIYIIMIIGLIYSFKNIKKEIILILIIFASYPIFVLGWMGINRYFIPSLFFLSIFFANGMSAIFSIKKSIKKLN